MANGVVCPHCKSELVGKVRQGDIVDCPECNRRFNVAHVDLDKYQKLQVKPVTVAIAGTEPVQQKKKMPTWVVLLIAFFGLGLLGNIVGGTKSQNSTSTNTTPTSTSTSTSNTTEEKKTEPKDDDGKYFSSWDGSNRELVNYVKEHMKDPSSFEHVETRFRDNGSSYDIIMKYRGKNSFNATTTEQVTAHFDKITRNLTEVQEVK